MISRRGPWVWACLGSGGFCLSEQANKATYVRGLNVAIWNFNTAGGGDVERREGKRGPHEMGTIGYAVTHTISSSGMSTYHAYLAV